MYPLISLVCIVITIFIVIAHVFFIVPQVDSIIKFEREIPWNNFKWKYQKVYNAIEEQECRQKFFDNLEFIKTNSEYAVNFFSDLTPQEFAYLYPYVNPEQQYLRRQTWNTVHLIPLEKLPENLNYLHLFPNPAYSQGNVDTCYAFASVGILEAKVYKEKLDAGIEQHVELSKQEIIDCGYGCGANGTNKGHMMNAFEYMTINGLYQERQYEYRHSAEFSGNSWIEHLKRGPKVAKQRIREYGSLPPKATDQELMTALVKYGPLAVGIFSSWPGFKAYNGTEIITRGNAPEGQPDHAVILVGWGKDQNTRKNFWIIRNSFGPEWGRNGYGFVEMGWNVLGINNHVSYIEEIEHLPLIVPMEVDTQYLVF